MKKSLFILFLFLSTPIVLLAQGRHGLGTNTLKSSQVRQGDERTAVKITPGKINSVGSDIESQHGQKRQSQVKATNEAVYYLNIVKRFGWFEGVGMPLSKEELCHVPRYYKLSNKNKAGKWTLMQAFNAYGILTTNHAIGTYILNQQDDYDTGANADWVEKLKTVCQWEFIGDNSGKEIIQERGLDCDNNIIFCYNPVKINSNTYSGSYTDGFGIPVFMRTDSLGNHNGLSNYVQVQLDERGYEVLYSYTDEKGSPRLNKDGAYMTSKTYDKNGRQIREASLNIVGNQVIDYYGNCGWESKADDYGNTLRETYFDANNDPIQMPGTRGSNKVYGYEYAYDKYHRLTDTWYLDSSLKRGVNEYGVYHQKCEYNTHGESTLLSTYDINGNLIAGDSLGIAQVVTKYDDQGNLLNLEWYNAQKGLVNGYGDYCKRIMSYNKQGACTLQEDYILDYNGDVTLKFKFSGDGKRNEIRYWYDDGYYRVDSVDVKGRETLVAWYDLNNVPIARPTDENDAWHKHVTTYNDLDNTEVELWLGVDGDPYVNTDYSLSNKYNKDIAHKDLAHCIQTNSQYLEPVGLAQKFEKQFDSNFDKIIAQWDVTPYGEHARVGWWNNLHYTCKVDYTLYGAMRTMVGVNEFGEPSYLVSLNDDGEVYHFSDMGSYYDEFGNVIPKDSMQTFKDRLPKAFCIEVTDTTIAYPLGLRNGDIILSYGEWATPEDLNRNLNYFYLETILKGQSKKSITVLRHNLYSRKSSVHTYPLPEGRPSELGFYPHQICYTQKESERLHKACKEYGFAYGEQTVPSEKRVLLGVQLKGGLIQTRYYHFPMYDFKDPGFLLYAKETYHNKSGQHTDTWSVANDDVNTWNERQMFMSSFSGKTKLYLTQDLDNVKELSKSGSGKRGLRIVPIYVSNDIYDKITNCVPDSLRNIEIPIGKVSTAPIAKDIKAKDVVGTWSTTMSEENVSADITISLDKKKNADVCTVLNIEGEISEGITIIMKVSITASGEWTVNGQDIIINYSDESKNVSIDKLDFRGVSEEHRSELMNLVDQNKSEIVNMFAGEDAEKHLPTTIQVESISKKEMSGSLNGNTKISFFKTVK